MTSLRKDIGIDISSINRSIKHNKLYLGTFNITINEHKDATISTMSIDELKNFLDTKREKIYTSNRPVYVYNHDLIVLYYKTSTTGELSRDLGINVNKGDS